MATFTRHLPVPDLWQQEAVGYLREGRDVVVHAPTGAGKTWVFELLVDGGLHGQAVFTVPTRALANDKLLEWRNRGWRVGIETGDVSFDRDAPVVVATLETQKRKLLTDRGPALLVVDEYQMLGDPARGLNYELAIAMAPPQTQLLLLSGSVDNPGDIVDWLRRCGRDAVCVAHGDRPVPLDEIHLDALPGRRPSKDIRGRWPRYLSRALAAGLGPVLVFAPRRKAAENLARSLASALPEEDPIVLSAEQRAVAGPELTKALKQRVAFHHSGMSYAQRAGLVEPLAKANQLKIIVATTGLAAGINFSMRSVLVLDREYRVADRHRLLRPDELLQMFGRAGRRGLDDRGTVLFTDEQPRLADARPVRLKRSGSVDWPSLLTVIGRAVEAQKHPLDATRELTQRLFSRDRVRLGLDDFLKQRKSPPVASVPLSQEQALSGGSVREFLNSEGIWERRRAPVSFPLKATWIFDRNEWKPALSTPRVVASIRIGTLCKEGSGSGRRYGRDAPLATFPRESGEDRLLLTKWLRKALREKQRAEGRKVNVPRLWTLEAIERDLLPLMPELTQGGKSSGLREKHGTLIARLDYAEARIHAFRERNSGRGLLNPPQRRRHIAGDPGLRADSSPASGHGGSVAEIWFSLGLIDEKARPTRRGRVFSFFNRGEGLAIAAALEEPAYAIADLMQDLANIRAGHRFNALGIGARPLAAICHQAYGQRSIPGYLRHGLPEDYGDGASEILTSIEQGSSYAATYIDDELSRGDIERAQVEWRSLRAHIAHGPDCNWERWRELKAACLASLERDAVPPPFEHFPPLTRAQGKSHRS